MTEADSYDEAGEGEKTRVVIQYRRSTKVAGKGSCIRLGVSGVCATASAFLIGGHFDSLFISHSFFDHSFPSFAMAGILKTQVVDMRINNLSPMYVRRVIQSIQTWSFKQ